MTRRQKIIKLIIGILLIGVPLLFWGITSISKTIQNNDSVITDRDTGEVYNKKDSEEQTGGSGIETGDAILFGIEPIIKQLDAEEKSTAFISSVRFALWKFGDIRLESKYETITLRPQDLVIGASEITGTIRLGQTDTILPITIEPSTNNKQAVVTINEGNGQFKGTFIYVGGIENQSNLLFTISQKDDHVSDLEIKTYEGYRDSALVYIESLGYNVPDFVINFSNYENPFDEK